MWNYSCAGLRRLLPLDVSLIALGFPIMVILSASLLAFGLFYPTGHGLNRSVLFV